MNADKVEGAVKDAAGKAQRKAGQAAGSTSQEVKGALKQAEGKAQKAVGKARDALKDSGRRNP